MPAYTFAVVGASASSHPVSQNVGGKIAHQLLKNGATVKILTRQEKADKAKIVELKEAGAEIAIIDYNDAASLDKALEGVDVVISTLAWEGFANQKAVAESAARQKSVKLFLPSEWGNNSLAEPDFSPLRHKHDFHATLKELKLPYLLVFHGPFSDIIKFFAGPHDGVISLPDGGTVPVASTPLEDVAAWTGYVLTHVPIDQLKNRHLVLEGSRMSFADISKHYTKQDPSIKVTNVSTADCEKKGREGDFNSFMVCLLSSRCLQSLYVAPLWKWNTNGRGIDGSEAEIKEATSLYPDWNPKPVTHYL